MAGGMTDICLADAQGIQSMWGAEEPVVVYEPLPHGNQREHTFVLPIRCDHITCSTFGMKMAP